MTTRNDAHIIRQTWARIAGLMFLLYIAVGITQMVIGGVSGEDAAAKLASMAQHAANVRINVVLTLVICFIALILAVALYVITREQNADLATLALMCRVGEGLIAAVTIPTTLGLLSLATATGPNAPNTGDTYAFASVLLSADSWSPSISATFFAVGSTIFSWLLLRGRMIPVPLAWLGVAASVLWVVGLPLQLVGVLPDSVTWLIYIPMAAFEIPLALWLLVKGVAMPARRQSA
jgi:hypothetical protein